MASSSEAAYNPAKPLENNKWEKFVQALADGFKPNIAYFKAYGTDGDAASVSASRLLRNAKVSSRLEFLKMELSNKAQERRRKKLKVLEGIWDDKDESNAITEVSVSDRLRALDIDNKMTGDYAPQKLDVSGGVELTLEGIAVEIDEHALEAAIEARSRRMAEIRGGANGSS